MTNLTQKTSPKEEIVIICEEKDRKYWADRLGVTAEVLKSAIRATGFIAFSQISEYLSQNKPSSYA